MKINRCETNPSNCVSIPINYHSFLTVLGHKMSIYSHITGILTISSIQLYAVNYRGKILWTYKAKPQTISNSRKHYRKRVNMFRTVHILNNGI